MAEQIIPTHRCGHRAIDFVSLSPRRKNYMKLVKRAESELCQPCIQSRMPKGRL